MTSSETSAAGLNAADALLGPTLSRGGGEEVAILFTDAAITYGALNRMANWFGNALSAHLSQGERALLLLKDSPDFIAAFLGIVRIGAVAVPLSTRLSAKDLAFVIGDSEANVLLIDEEFVPLYREAVASVERRPRLVAVRGRAEEGEQTFAALMENAASELASASAAADDMAFWLYTSGTTGAPKAAIHAHGDVVGGDLYLKAFGYSPGERVFSSSKLFFAFALTHVLIGGLRAGAAIILYDGWPDSEAIAAVVERYRPTIMLSVPAFFRNLLREGQASQPGFKAVRHYVSAGEALPESLYHRWLAVTGRPIVEGIGATETLFLMVSGTPADHCPGATGKPMPYVEAKLMDGDRLVMEAETPGVLWVRMSSLCRGYWRQPEKTAAAFYDGWYRTGDAFIVGQDGWWRHQGRGDDLLKISGQWVSPTEIEECAMTVPGVAEAVVVGVPDSDGLVRLAMFLVAVDGGGSESLKQQVQDKLRVTLSKYKCPRNVVFIDVVPRTPTGKVRRFQLRQWLTADLLARLMRALDLDIRQVAAVRPQVIIDMQRRCAICDSQDRCAHDLDDGVGAGAFREYCPNAEILVDMQFARQTP